jgi:flavin reductase (DIM6/NTAB) family NADH-FMN oxidoreductase RutF
MAVLSGRRADRPDRYVRDVSFDGTPTIIVRINRNASALPVVKLRRRFCVNILASDHQLIGDRFAGSRWGKRRGSLSRR